MIKQRDRVAVLIPVAVLAWSWAVPSLDAQPAPAPAVNLGPSEGERIPGFEASDQHGSPRSWENLRGSKGAVLVFYRSADW